MAKSRCSRFSSATCFSCIPLRISMYNISLPSFFVLFLFSGDSSTTHACTYMRFFMKDDNIISYLTHTNTKGPTNLLFRYKGPKPAAPCQSKARIKVPHVFRFVPWVCGVFHAGERVHLSAERQGTKELCAMCVPVTQHPICPFQVWKEVVTKILFSIGVHGI